MIPYSIICIGAHIIDKDLSFLPSSLAPPISTIIIHKKNCLAELEALVPKPPKIIAKFKVLINKCDRSGTQFAGWEHASGECAYDKRSKLLSRP